MKECVIFENLNFCQNYAMAKKYFSQCAKPSNHTNILPMIIRKKNVLSSDMYISLGK